MPKPKAGTWQRALHADRTDTASIHMDLQAVTDGFEADGTAFASRPVNVLHPQRAKPRLPWTGLLVDLQVILPAGKRRRVVSYGEKIVVVLVQESQHHSAIVHRVGDSLDPTVADADTVANQYALKTEAVSP